MIEQEKPKLVSVSSLGVIESYLDRGFDNVKKYENFEFSDIPEEVETIAKGFEKIGGRCFLEGGCVRDAVIKKEHSELDVQTKDFDMEIYGIGYGDAMNFLKTQFGDKNVTVDGATFGVIRIKIPGKNLQLEAGIPRVENKTGEGHKGFEIYSKPSMKMLDAASRRDLTMNSMLYDPLTKTLFDPYGGVSDIKSKTIRANDLQTFAEDPLRVLRVMQFVARFGFGVDEGLTNLCSDLVRAGELEPIKESTKKTKTFVFEKRLGELEKDEIGILISEGSAINKKVLTEKWTKGITAERLTGEVTKMLLQAVDPSAGMEFIRNIGYVQKHWPEIAALVDLKQNEEWHPEGDVWRHTLETMNAAKLILDREESLGRINEKEKKVLELTIMFSAMLHDVGKVNPKNSEGYDEHDKAAGPIIAEFFSRMSHNTVGEDSRWMVTTLVREHMNYLALWDRARAGNDVSKEVRKMFTRMRGGKDFSKILFYSLAIVSESDVRARNPNKASLEPLDISKTAAVGSVDWAYQKSIEVDEEIKITPKKPSKEIIENLKTDKSEGSAWIVPTLKCLDLDLLDGIAVVSDVADLTDRARRYRDALSVVVNGKVQLEGRQREQIWAEIRKMDDPRTLLDSKKDEG